MYYVPVPNHMALLLLALLILLAAIYEQQGCPMDSVYGKVLKDKHQYIWPRLLRFSVSASYDVDAAL